MEVVVVKAKDKRLIRVTTNNEAVSAATTTEWEGLTISESHLSLNQTRLRLAFSLHRKNNCTLSGCLIASLTGMSHSERNSRCHEQNRSSFEKHLSLSVARKPLRKFKFEALNGL